jgi:hypothetical protein
MHGRQPIKYACIELLYILLYETGGSYISVYEYYGILRRDAVYFVTQVSGFQRYMLLSSVGLVEPESGGCVLL